MRVEGTKYRDLITIENLFQAYFEFRKDKRKKYDVQLFERNLEDNLFELHRLLKTRTYRHSSYQEYYVNDPKRRHIHKAQVSDRIVHHLLYKYLYELFDKSFIYDSYSCRNNKGTHRAVKRLELFARKVSRNYTRDFWALKLDIKRFFESINHDILLDLIRTKIQNEDIIWLIQNVLNSFHLPTRSRKGIPLGNLTSQIFANIFMNQFDQFIKHKVKMKYYLRYADDFTILSEDKDFLFSCIDTSRYFLRAKLNLELHPEKIVLRKLSWGIDFCGYIILPHYILTRTKTKRRMLRKIEERAKDYYRGEIDKFCFDQTLASYFGYLLHSNSFKLKKKIYF